MSIIANPNAPACGQGYQLPNAGGNTTYVGSFTSVANLEATLPAGTHGQWALIYVNQRPVEYKWNTATNSWTMQGAPIIEANDKLIFKKPGNTLHRPQNGERVIGYFGQEELQFAIYTGNDTDDEDDFINNYDDPFAI